MNQPDSPSRKNDKYSPRFGFGHLPPAFDLALRWGLTLAVAVLLGFFIGRWLDLKLGTTPLFLLIGLFWGLGGSFYSIYLQVKKMQEDEEKKPKQ
ncbi:MAG: AtpZ/AtpI family protein [bacterium]